MNDIKTQLIQQKKVFGAIKIVSTILIISAILWELWNIYAGLNDLKIPRNLQPIFWLDRFALTAHLIEAIIAVFWLSIQKKHPLKYGIYTFFVGTVGLLELFIEKHNQSHLSSLDI